MIDSAVLDRFHKYFNEIEDELRYFMEVTLPEAKSAWDAESDFHDDLQEMLRCITKQDVQIYFGATRACAVFSNEDYVLKFPRSEYDIKYQRLEVAHYDNASERLKPFFAECQMLNDELGVTIQQRVEFDPDRVEEIQSHNYASDDDMYDNDVSYDVYGDLPIWDELSNYLCENEINDIHEMNVGWVDLEDELPIMIDYAGY